MPCNMQDNAGLLKREVDRTRWIAIVVHDAFVADIGWPNDIKW